MPIEDLVEFRVMLETGAARRLVRSIRGADVEVIVSVFVAAMGLLLVSLCGRIL